MMMMMKRREIAYLWALLLCSALACEHDWLGGSEVLRRVAFGGVRATRVFVAASLLLASHLFAWRGSRWQMAPAMLVHFFLMSVYSAAVAKWCNESHVTLADAVQASLFGDDAAAGPQLVVTLWPAIGAVALVLLSAVLNWLFPLVQFPRLRGPFRVGVTTYHIVPSTPPAHKAPKANKENGDEESPDEFNLRVYYPAGRRRSAAQAGGDRDRMINEMRHGKQNDVDGDDDDGGEQTHASSIDYTDADIFRSPWLVHGHATASGFARFAKIPPFLFSHMHNFQIPAGRNAPLVRRQECDKLPVIVFSHGLGATPCCYHATMLELASHGYLVAAVEHNDRSSAMIRMRDGEVRYYTPLADLKEQRQATEYEVRHAQLMHRVSEVAWSLDHLAALNRGDRDDFPHEFYSTMSASHGRREPPDFTGRIDMGRVASMGHSFGGATATESARLDYRIHACVKYS
eukprot:TRINITY_DN67179_c8_g5_i1.p1 TRINITY_DN67179_c8_g5~~TRINITY_DN67179_c8_g5_i1.p1  ORF type:complete len:459 (-),score=194.60 TRINITY_DN67179_c8_g5_i1:1523-2899(-)